MRTRSIRQRERDSAVPMQTRPKPASALRKPNPLSPAGSLLSYQQAYGNRAVQRLLNNAVMQRQCACSSSPGPAGTCAECGNELSSLNRTTAGSPEVSAIPPIVNEVIDSPGQPLDSATRGFMEPRFGHDFGDVRVHTDSMAARSAQAVDALAYTVGRDIVFGEGQYAPGTASGQKLLAHELTHTVQQTNALAREVAGVSQPGDASELEADQVAEQVMRLAPDAETIDHADAQSASEQVVLEDERDNVILGDRSGRASGGRTRTLARTPAIQAIQARSLKRMMMRTPSVGSWSFHNTDGTNTASDNCCTLCPRPLGVGNKYSSRVVNGMELQVFLNDAFPSKAAGATYDLKRVAEASTWELVGGAWNRTFNAPAGTNDDPDNNDECLTPVLQPPFLPYIFVEDQPGYGNTTHFDASATEAVFKASFTESLDITTSAGVVHDPKTFDWHSQLWLVKSGGAWTVDTTRSEIAPGTLTVGATP